MIPSWREWAEKVQRAVRQDQPFAPVAYDIRDELSTTISANPFDYDFSPIAMGAFRKWLEQRYGNLAALNAEWETGFKSWDEVKPFTTDQVKNRMGSGDAAPRGNPDWQAVEALKFDPKEAPKQPTRWNFAPWCDFRTYMDSSLASALNDIRLASSKADPHTPVGIEGTQMGAAFGGYDLWRLSQVLDWVEPYDIGNAREIFGSFMPGKPIPSRRSSRKKADPAGSAGSGICCSKATKVASSGGARIASIGRAMIMRSRRRRKPSRRFSRR